MLDLFAGGPPTHLFSGMREHSLMYTPSHAFPPEKPERDIDVDLALRPYDAEDTWPSELAIGGRVGWSTFHTAGDGWVEICYPDIQ
jgi:hypothetical protein